MSITSPTQATIRVLQPARTETTIRRPALIEASKEDVVASTCSCVVHLCGCGPGPDGP